MIERVLESKDTQKYDYQSSLANINEYGFFAKQIELNWIRVTNWSDYLIRAGAWIVYPVFLLFTGNFFSFVGCYYTYIYRELIHVDED